MLWMLFKEQSQRNQKIGEQHTMIEDEKESNAESVLLVVGGENGANSVTAAKLAGLFPVVADEGYNYVIQAQSELVLSKEEYCELKGERQKEEKQDEDEELAVQVDVQEMGIILEQ